MLISLLNNQQVLATGVSTTVTSFPSTPSPAYIREEPVTEDILIGQFESGYEVRRNRWHRHRKEFVLVYKTITSGDSAVQALENHAAIRDFLFTKRLQRDKFTWTHPYYPNSVYTVRFNGETLSQQRKARTPADSGTDIWEMEIKLIEVF